MTSLEHPENYVIVPASATNTRDLFASMIRINYGLTWGLTWRGAHEAVSEEGAFMPTPRQFIDLLMHLRSDQPVYNGRGTLIEKSRIDSMLDDILTRRDPYRAEWLDANFKFVGPKLVVDFNHRIVREGLIPENREPLEDCLMECRHVDLFSANRQGLPTRDSANQDIYFYPPLSEGNSVAGFGAGSGGVYLGCGRNPQSYGTGLGVRKFFER